MDWKTQGTMGRWSERRYHVTWHKRGKSKPKTENPGESSPSVMQFITVNHTNVIQKHLSAL
jgi:hypothetical protein